MKRFCITACFCVLIASNAFVSSATATSTYPDSQIMSVIYDRDDGDAIHKIHKCGAISEGIYTSHCYANVSGNSDCKCRLRYNKNLNKFTFIMGGKNVYHVNYNPNPNPNKSRFKTISIANSDSRCACHVCEGGKFSNAIIPRKPYLAQECTLYDKVEKRRDTLYVPQLLRDN